MKLRKNSFLHIMFFFLVLSSSCGFPAILLLSLGNDLLQDKALIVYHVFRIGLIRRGKITTLILWRNFGAWARQRLEIWTNS